MTISANDNPQQYTGTGANTELSTVFVFVATTDVVVTQRVTSTGDETVMVSGTHYNITGGSAAGAVGAVTPIAGSTDFTSAMTWTLERQETLTQALDYVENDSFPAASHESGMDKMTRLSQDTRVKSTRSLRFPTTDLASLTSQIPDSVTRASKVLSFDASGNVTVSTPTTVGFGKVLLDSEEASASATVEMTATDWPATYDRIELELVNVLSASGTLLTLKPIDSGSATTTNISSQIVQIIAGTLTGANASDWQLNTAAGATPDDVVSGSAIFTYNGGFLNGVGDWTYRSTTNHISNWVSYQRHTTIGTQWDGIEISFSAGNITSGSIRLWGFPKL